MQMECDSVRMCNENKMYRNVLFDSRCQCSRELKFKRLKCSIWNSVVKISRRSLRLHKFTRTYIFHYTALKRTTSSSNGGGSRWSLLPAISLNHAPLSPLGLFLSPPSSAGSVAQGMRRSYEKRPEANAFCSVVRKMRVIFSFFIALPLPAELRTALAREPMATTGHKLSNNTSVP